MKIARFLIYEGSENWLKATLSKSLSEGETDLGRGKITIMQFPDLKIPDNGRNYEELFREIDRIEDDDIREAADAAFRAWERAKNM